MTGKRLVVVPNPVDLEKTRVGVKSKAEIARITISEGATFIEPGIVVSITEEFEFIRKAGVQHIHAGYSFEPGVTYYVGRDGELTTEQEGSVHVAGVGTQDNGLLLGLRSYLGEFIDEYRQFFVDENGIGFDDPTQGNLVLFIDSEGRLFVDSEDRVFTDPEV